MQLNGNNTRRRGFIFTTDAFIALALVSMVILVIIYQLNIPSALFAQQAQTYDYASDAVLTFGQITIGNLRATGDLPNPSGFPASEDQNTVLEQIAKDRISGDASDNARAELLASQLLASGTEPLIPAQFGASIFVFDSGAGATGAWKEVQVREKQYTRVQSAASRVLLSFASSRDNTAPPYNYPPDDAVGSPYCQFADDPTATLPCVQSFGPTDIPEALGPTFVRVVIWT